MQGATKMDDIGAVLLDDLAPARRISASVIDAARRCLAGIDGHAALVITTDSLLASAHATSKDGPTDHPAMRVARAAMLAQPREILGQAALVSSLEPCGACVAAMFHAGIGRLVYGSGREGPAWSLGARDILARAGARVVVRGPVFVAAAGKTEPSSDDLPHLRRAIALSTEAIERGEMPFGAVIVSRDGTVLGEAISTELGDHDWTCHAETNLVRKIVPGTDPAILAGSTLYASAEPCGQCANQIALAGIRRIVFAFGEPRLRRLLATGDDTVGLGLGSREVLAHLGDAMEIHGPILEDEAAKPHETYWSKAGDF